MIKKDIHNDPAYGEGRNSYSENAGKLINNYERGTDEHNLFERGWVQSLKRSPNVYSRSRIMRYRSSLRRARATTKPQLTREVEESKRAYERRKG